MAIINPDFTELPKLPAGHYRARIVGCKPGVSQNGTPYMTWKFETVTNNAVTNRRWVFLSTTFKGQGAQLLKQMVRAAYDPSYEQGPIDTTHLMNREVMITVERITNRDGSEQKYPQVMDISPVDANENFSDARVYGHDYGGQES